MRRRRPTSDAQVERWIARGFGQGIGITYKPWFKVRDVPSRGRAKRVRGIVVPRIHHLLSGGEYNHFLFAEFQPDVIDIREHIALLPRSETLEIAQALGIRHPIYPTTKIPVVMRSDLALTKTTSNGSRELVLCIIPASNLTPGTRGLRRTVEKLKIERAYWERRCVVWRLATEHELDPTLIANLDRLRMWVAALEVPDNPLLVERVVKLIALKEYCGGSVRQTIEYLAGGLSESFEVAYTHLARAIWSHRLPIDLSRPFEMDSPLYWHSSTLVT